MYNKLKDFQITLVAIIIAIALLITATTIVSSIRRNDIAVTGSASKIVKSDTAILKLAIKSKNSSKSLAYKTISQNIPIVKTYLLKEGISDSEINILPPENYPIYETNPKTGYTTNEISGYSFSQTIQIKSNNVDKINQLAIATQSLLEQGIDLDINEPEYYYSKLSDIKIELLKAASNDAKQRAKGMLSATNNKVGQIQSIKMGVFQITPADSNEVSDSGISDISSVDKKVTAVANVVFGIK